MQFVVFLEYTYMLQFMVVEHKFVLIHTFLNNSGHTNDYSWFSQETEKPEKISHFRVQKSSVSM